MRDGIVHSFYLLDGRYEELGVSELKALLEIYGERTDIQCYTMICTSLVREKTLHKVKMRAGFIKEAGILVGLGDISEPLLKYSGEIDPRFNWLKPVILKSTISKSKASEYLEKLGRELNLDTRYKEGEPLYVFFSGSYVFVGYLVKHRLTSRSLGGRTVRAKPFTRSIALTPDISRYLVNLARVREGDVVLDPFVGTGSVLIEAGLMGIRGIGVDISEELVNGSKINLDYYGLKNGILLVGDSTITEYVEVDGVATDPPYGRAASTYGSKLDDLYKSFIEKTSISVKRGGHVVFMSPNNMESFIRELLCENELFLKGVHYMYVHRGLTRAIYEAVKL